MKKLIWLSYCNFPFIMAMFGQSKIFSLAIAQYYNRPWNLGDINNSPMVGTKIFRTRHTFRKLEVELDSVDLKSSCRPWKPSKLPPTPKGNLVHHNNLFNIAHYNWHTRILISNNHYGRKIIVDLLTSIIIIFCKVVKCYMPLACPL